MTDANPRLVRTITLWPLVLFGIAYVTPFIVLTTFGVFSEASNGTLATAYTLTTIAMLFTAISYGKLARLYPRSGSAYTYARRAIGPRTGFMVGWAILLDYFFLPMVVWLIGTAYLTEQFPAVPAWVFLLGFIVLTTGLNIIGIKVATRTNLVLITFQILVLVFFLVLSLRHIVDVSGPAAIVSADPFWNSTTTITAVSAGAALTAYSFIGFDAVSTFAEETVDARKTVPRAIVLTAVLAGVIFIVVAYITQLVHPGGQFENADSAALDIARTIGGDLFGALFLATVIIAQFTAGIPIQAAGARLMFAMGRDGVLPKRLFSYVSTRWRTPVFNLVLTGVVGLIALLLTVASSTSFINFGAFTAFAFVNIAVIFQYVRDRGTVKRNAVSWIVQPLIGLAVIIWLMTHLDSNALILGGIWLVAGFLWLLWLTRGLRQPPPEMDFADSDDDQSVPDAVSSRTEPDLRTAGVTGHPTRVQCPPAGADRMCSRVGCVPRVTNALARVRCELPAGRAERQLRLRESTAQAKELDMTRYLISFPGPAMQVADEDLAEVAEAARAVVQEAIDAGVYLFAGGINEDVEPVLVAGDGTVTSGTYPQTREFDGGFTVLDLPSREAAEEWAAKIAVACRCSQELREFQTDRLSQRG